MAFEKQRAMRPRSLVYFDWLYGLSLVLTGIQMALQPGNPDVSGAVTTTTYVITFAVSLVIWYAISLRASKGMRWINTILVGLSLLSVFFTVAASRELSTVELALTLLNSVFDVVGVFVLFTPEAKSWFANGGNKDVVNPSVFS